MLSLIKTIWKELHKSEVKILTALISILIALSVIAFLSNKYSNRVAASTSDVERAQEIKFNIQEILSVSTDVETGARGYIISGNEKYLEPANKSIGIIFKDITYLKTAFVDNSTQLSRVNKLEELIDQKVSLSTRAIEIRRDKGLDDARIFISSGNGRELMNEIRTVTDRMMNEEALFLKIKSEENRRNLKDFNITFNLLLVKITISILSVFFVLRYYFRKRRISEHELRETKEELQSIIDNTSAVIFIKDLTGKYIMINRQFEDLFHSRKQEAKGKTDYELFSRDVANAIRKTDLEVIENRKLMQFEEEIPNYGEVRNYISIKFPLFDKNNEVYAICGNATDITDIKRMEQSIRENEERFRMIVNTAKDAFISMDIKGHITEWNPQAEATFGWKREEAIGRDLADTIIPERYRELHRRGLKHFLVVGEGPVLNNRVEIEGLHRDGHEFPIELGITAMRLGDVTVFSAFAHDISLRKKAEEEIKRTNDFMNAILENIPDMVFVKDAKDLRFVRFNKAGEKLLGYSKKDLIGKNDYDFFPKEQADAFTNKDREVINKKEMTDIKEEPIDTANGKRWLHTKKIVLTDENGDPTYLMGISEDITERKRLEELLMKRTEEILDLFNNAPCGYLSTDMNGIVIEMNDTQIKWLGYTREELIGKMPTQDLMSDDSIHIFTYYYPKLRAGEIKSVQDIEIRFKRKDGSVFPALVNTIGIYDSDGKFIRTRSSIFDITVMKKAESLFTQN